MSSLPADLLIWALLFAGAVFFGIGLMGLILFPDTKSRMFTAFRGTAIGLGAVTLAAIVYAVTLYTATGDGFYLSLVIRALVLALVLAAGTWVMYGNIRKRVCRETPACAGIPPADPEAGKPGQE